MKKKEASNFPGVNREEIRKKILQEALDIVTGERQQQYGRPEDNFKTIAELWDSYLKRAKPARLSARCVADMMILMKVARLAGGGTHDCYVDIAGYAACGGEIMDNAMSKADIQIPGCSRLRAPTPIYSENFINILREMKKMGIKLNAEGEALIRRRRSEEGNCCDDCLRDQGL